MRTQTHAGMLMLTMLLGCGGNHRNSAPESRIKSIDDVLASIETLVKAERYDDAVNLVDGADAGLLANAAPVLPRPRYLAVAGIMVTIPGVPPEEWKSGDATLLPGTGDVLTSPGQAAWQGPASKFAREYNSALFARVQGR